MEFAEVLAQVIDLLAREKRLAYRALNRCADAVPMYEKYLELKPESRFTERVRRDA